MHNRLRLINFVGIAMAAALLVLSCQSAPPPTTGASSTPELTLPPPPTATPAAITPAVPVHEYEDSAFGVFAAFAANGFPYFKNRLGFGNDEYWAWAETRLHDLGAHWTRSNLQLVWDIVEPDLGAGYRWDNVMLTDAIIARMYAPGNALHWLGVFHDGSGPDSTPRPDRPLLRNPLDDPEGYAAFVRAVVERYDGDGVDDAAPGVRVKYWQAGNEVFAWQESGRSIDDYAQYVRLIRQAARSADPEAKIALIAPTDGGQVDPFLVRVIETLAAERAFEVIDVHHWGAAPVWRMRAVPQYRALLDARGLADVQIWSTEHGTWQGEPMKPPMAQTEEDQARSLIKRYVYNLNNGLDKLFWNNLVEWFNFSGNPASVFNAMGLIADGQGPGDDPARFDTERVAYWAYRLLAANTDTPVADRLGPVPEVYVEDQLYAYAYRRRSDDRRLYILWSEVGDLPVTLPVGSPQVRVTGLITDRFGRVLQEQALVATNRQVALIVGNDPLLVEETYRP